MDKASLRRQMIALRAKESGRTVKDKSICESALKICSDCRNVFVYVSVGGEVSTHELIEHLAKTKQIFVPLTDKFSTMRAIDLPKTYDLHNADKLGNIAKSGECRDGQADAAIVPLVAFDDRNYRVGYGAGCYDRYFADYPCGLKIGLAYDSQLSEFEHDNTDIPMDIIITPTRVIRRQK